MEDHYSRRSSLKKAAVIPLISVGCKSIDISTPVPKPITFAQISDTHLGYKKHTEKNLPLIIEQINQHAPDLVIHTGDVAHFHVIQEWKSFHQITSHLSHPIYFVPGNHDLGKLPTEKSLKQWQDYMGPNNFVVIKEKIAFIGFDSTSFWRVDWKDPQGQIKRQKEEIQQLHSALDLAKHCNTKLVFSHFPIYLTDLLEDDYSNVIAQKKLRKQILKVLTNKNCNAYICGHTHFGWQNELTFQNKKIIQTASPSLSYPAMIPKAQKARQLQNPNLLGWNLWKIFPHTGLLAREFIRLKQKEPTIYFSQ